MTAAEGAPLLSAVEAARRLGVKPETLYAYVSRGFLASVRAADGRRSGFDPAEIERLLNRPRRPGKGAGGLVVHTRLTDIRGGRLHYRGRPAVDLSERTTFEAVARLLWSGELQPGPFAAPDDLVAAGRAAASAVPDRAPLIDRVQAAVLALGAADPLRGDLRPGAVVATAATMVAAVADSVPGPTVGQPGVAARLWPKLVLATSGNAVVDAAVLDAALVLLADHEPGPAALAARLVASGRAHPYAAIVAALAAAAAPGGTPASAPLHRALADAEREGVATVLSRLLTDGRGLPGFGHALHPDGDPRARALLDRLESAPPDPRRWGQVVRFIAASSRGTPVPPNIDFALAALTYTAGMAPDAGEAIFAIARMAGWLAHAIEEYAEEPGRLRPATTYIPS